jgi:hypothetical protein
MHSKKFDEIIASLAAAPSRRTALKGLAGSLAAFGTANAADLDGDAAKRNRRSKKNKRKNKDKNKKNGNGAGDEHRGKKGKKNVKRCKRPKRHCGNRRKCFNLKKNAKHCGACHNACDPGETCVQGVCTGS